MNEKFWLGRAAREARRFNFGWWLQRFLPWVLGVGIGGAAVLLALRGMRGDLRIFGWALAIVLAAGAITAFVSARRKFLSRRESLTRLDADLHLRNRLTSASEGVGEWPAPHDRAAFSLRWNWLRLLTPPLAAAAILFAAWKIPLPEENRRPAAANAEPPAWGVTEAKLDELRREDLVQRESVDEMQAALDALRKQPSDEWFRHESLEAGDHLQNQLDQNLADLQKNLESALGALEASREIEEAQLAVAGQPLNEALQNALQGMELGKLPLNAELLSQLKNLNAAQARQLTAEQWKEISERLKAGIGTCSGGDCDGEGEGAALIALLMQGGGGVSRGPGAAPLTLSDTETQLGTTKTETVSSDDLARAAMGDMMGLGTGEHKVDRNAWNGTQAGGAMAAPGSGGEAVWQQSASPAEQEALRQFFK